MALNTSRIKLGPANQIYVGGLFYYRERTPPFHIQDNIRVEFVPPVGARVSPTSHGGEGKYMVCLRANIECIW